MNTSTSSLTTKVDIKDSTKETTQTKTSETQEFVYSPDSDATSIMRKRRLRRGRAIAAAAVSCTTARIVSSS